MKKTVLLVACCVLQIETTYSQPGTVLWTYDAGNLITSSPTLAQDGAVYVSAATLLAVTNAGGIASNKWSHPLVGPTAVDASGDIYVTTSSALRAINPDGSAKWTFNATSAGNGVVAAPAVALDGSVLFLAGGKLYAVSPSGTELWHYSIDLTGIGAQAPVIGSDGAIYVGVDRRLYAFDSAGSNTWSSLVNLAGIESPSLSFEDTVFCSVGPLAAFASYGSNIWVTDYAGFAGSPTIGKSGNIYAAGENRTLYAVTPQGTPLWHIFDSNPQYGQYTAPAVDAGGRIYYCVSNNIWCINPQGQVQWSIGGSPLPNPAADIASTSPVIGPDGTLYAALGSTLYAVATGTNGPADSPWPMYRGNVRHTGKIEKPSLKRPKKRADANFEFQLHAQLGQTNVIETTTNLNTWTSLTSIVVTTVPQPVVDLTASNHPARFYRSTAP